VWFRFNAETRDLLVQLKAKGLWAHGAGAEGYAIMAGYWLRELLRMFTGEEMRSARASGWKCTGLEVCRDFTGLELFREDAGNFIGARMNGDDGERLTVWGGEQIAVETINVGRRSSPISLCIYDKLKQIEAAKDGDGSTYAATHRAWGWDGEERITRVEMRFSGPGLIWENKDTGEVLDFSDPATATDQESLRELWRLSTAKRRLICPDTSTRRTRASIDPRWAYVESLGEQGAPHGWRQLREVHEDTHRTRTEQSRKAMLRAAARYGALHGLQIDPFDRAGHLAGLVRDGFACEELLDLEAYQVAYFRSQLPLLGVEVERARGELLERVRRRRAVGVGSENAEMHNNIGPA
jgi:hypothetical protein